MTTPIKSPWALAQLENAIIALRMPLGFTEDGNIVHAPADSNTIEAGLVAANWRIAELMAENANLNQRLQECRAALRPFADAYFQSIHNSETWQGTYDRIDLSYLVAALNQFGGYSGMLATVEMEQPQ